MKKMLFALLSLVLLLSGCASSVVDLDTPKSKELSAQYDFYADSMNTLRAGMGVTPEQADEIFIVLVSCGLNEKVSSVTKSGDGYKARAGYATYDIQLADGAVSSIMNGLVQLYPVPEVSESPEPSAVIPDEPETLEQAVDSAIEGARAEKISVDIHENAGTAAEGDMNVNVYLQGNDNLTANMIRNGMFIQANDILKSLQPREDVAQVCLFWSLSLVDSYGNAKDWNVLKILVKSETLDKINFDNFDWNKLPEIADDYYEHSSLSE